MAEITAAMVKDLRSRTGAGMMDCKKALNETDGDIDAAVDYLRKKGLSTAQKKSGRVAAEGLIGAAVEDTRAALVEVNSETDFVARNEQFQKFVSSVAQIALGAGGNLDALMASTYPDSGRTLSDEVTHQIATIGENIAIRRTAALTVDAGHIGHYVHGAVNGGLGKIGVLVALESDAPGEVLEPLGKHLAMHVAATNPQSLGVDDLDPQIVEREKTVLGEQARASGKPEEIVEKMIEGRMRKFYEEVVLLKQTSVVDGENRIEKVLSDASEKAGTDIKLSGFVRFALGEGIEKEESDFAEEVRSAAGQ